MVKIQKKFIKILGFGIEKNIEIKKTLKGSDLRSFLELNDKVSLYKSLKKSTKILKLNSIIKDGDVIILIQPLEGAVDFKYQGERWRFHKNDADPVPSTFHAHNYEKKQTIDLNTGIIYKAHTKQGIKRISTEDRNNIVSKLNI